MRKFLEETPSSTDLKGHEESNLLGKEPGLTKFRSSDEAHVLPWDFIQRSMYSAGNLNPRRRIESPYREGTEDVIREVSTSETSSNNARRF